MARRTATTVIAFVLCGCSTPSPSASVREPIDPRQFAEELIETTMAADFGVGVAARCDDPTSRDPATTFDCVGVMSTGREIPFIATITTSREVSIALGDIP